MRFLKQHWFNIIFVLSILVIWIIVHSYFNPKPEPEVALKELNELQKKSSEIIIEMNKLMTSLATLVVGGLGALLLKRYDTLKIESAIPRILVAASSLFAIFSIYFGYILYFKMVEMLSNSFYNPNNSLIEEPRKLQYYCLWLSVILFVVLVLVETTGRSEKQISNAKDVAVPPRLDASATVKEDGEDSSTRTEPHVEDIRDQEVKKNETA